MCSLPALANICGVMGAAAIPYLSASTPKCFSIGLALSVNWRRGEGGGGGGGKLGVAATASVEIHKI